MMKFIIFSPIQIRIRIPPFGDKLRGAWLSAIEKIQPVDRGKCNLEICINHFDQSDVIHSTNGSRLKPGVRPTIFKISSIPQLNRESDSTCEDCSNLKIENEQLKKVIVEKDLAIAKIKYALDGMEKK